MLPLYQFSLQQVDSTNSWAKRNISRFPLDGIAYITALEQTAGRGRYERTWHSPPGENLYLTLVIPLSLLPASCVNAPLLELNSRATSATLQTAEAFGVKASIKLPNDIMTSNGKLGGILVESGECEKGLYGIVGIGLNITSVDFSSVSQRATSLFLETGKVYSQEVVLSLLLERFCHSLHHYSRD